MEEENDHVISMFRAESGGLLTESLQWKHLLKAGTPTKIPGSFPFGSQKLNVLPGAGRREALPSAPSCFPKLISAKRQKLLHTSINPFILFSTVLWYLSKYVIS